MAESKRNALMLYFDTAPAVNMLSDEDCGKLFKAMMSYAMSGTVPEFEGTLAVIWALIQPKIDYDGQRYIEAILQRKYAVYVREVKRKKQQYMSFDEWKSVNEDYRPINPFNEQNSRYPYTSSYSSTKTITSTSTNTTTNTHNINADKPHCTKGFVKPSLDDVKEYCMSRGNDVDAEAFIDYYESNGWKVGRNVMKDWKASVRYWERNQIQNKTNKTGNRSRTAADYQKDSEDSL